MKQLTDLEQRIKTHIPLTRHLGFRLLEWGEGRLRLCAPLAENVNDKGTFFAGSQAALLALSGWALTTLEAEADGEAMDVVAVKSSLAHRAPAPFDATLVAVAAGPERARFRDSLIEKGRGRLNLSVSLLGPDGQEATTYEGQYLARRLERKDD